MERTLDSLAFLLKGLLIDLLRLTHSELQHWDTSSKGTKDIWGETELSDIKVMAGGAAFSHTKVLAEVIVPFLTPPPTEPSGRCYSWVSISLAKTVALLWWFPETLPYHTCRLTKAISSGFSIQTTSLGSCFRLFPKIFQTNISWSLCILYLFLRGPRPGTSGNKSWFAA